jgi:hypothetical protein
MQIYCQNTIRPKKILNYAYVLNNIHTTYTVNSFGKAIAHVQNCLLKKMHMAQTKTLTKTTQKGGFSKLCVKIKKSTPFFNT